MKRTNIYLDQRQTEALDRLATQEGVSRAQIIRRLLDKGLDTPGDDVARDLEAIEASFGAGTELGGDERRTDERQEHLDRLWQHDKTPTP